jgi:uncharacterized protein (DUF1499 family)
VWLRSFALVLAILAAVLLALSGPGVRFGLWPLNAGLILLGVAGLLGLAAVIAAIVGLCMPRVRSVGLLVALAIGAAAAVPPVSGLVRARSVPPIHDLSTDTENPPEFVAALKLRAGAPNPPGYAGNEVAEQQRKAYPDLQPLFLGVSPATAFARARAAAEAMGWEIVAADPVAGRIEAVATTFWFGFKDDIVVRITPAGAGSRIDARSKSRVGVGDLGTNAQRIRAYLQRLR